MLTRKQFVGKMKQDVKDAYDVVGCGEPGGRTPPVTVLEQLAFGAVLHRLLWMKTTDFKDEEEDD